MKIGRNLPCPCGSGLKYKKCCLDENEHTSEGVGKDYFQIKGSKAESVVHDLSIKSFLTDWCYLNPNLPNNKEICDLLVVFDDIAIVWQIKSLKLRDDGSYKKGDVEKNFRQLIGAKRRLFEIDTEINLENPRRGKELFNPKSISQVFLVSVLMGPPEDFFSFVETINGNTIHVFDREFTEIVLNELDTISDFCEYLKSKERLIAGKEMMIMGGEKELLAYYLQNNRSFSQFNEATNILLQEGIWEGYISRSEYKKKKKADEFSYGWDSIIDRAHEGSIEYERVARELARPNRFERRMLSKTFLEAHIRAHEDTKADMFRRILTTDGVSYVFLFFSEDHPRDHRKQMLFAICFFARGKFGKNTKVIGIATEKRIEPTCSYDYCVINKPEWTDDDQNRMLKLQDELELFKNPKIARISEDEYPKN
jgi:hypothetical protein